MVVYAIIFLTSLSTLVLEVTLTRIFSITQWYHLAFMVVSLALLGLGASGSLLMFMPRLRRVGPGKVLPFTTLGLSVTTLAAYLAANHVPFEMVRLSYDYRQFFYLVLYYVLFLFPFLFGGLTVSLVLTNLPRQTGRIYCSDLLGAGCGCLTALIAHALGGVVLCLIVVSSASLIASMLTTCEGRRWPLFTGIAFLAVIAFFTLQPVYLQPAISPYKDLEVALRYPEARLVLTRFNTFSQLDVVESPAVRFAPGLSLKYMKPLPPRSASRSTVLT